MPFNDFVFQKEPFEKEYSLQFSLRVQSRQNFFFFFFLISNKDLLITKRERHPSTQGVYRGVHIKYKNYINQENPKKKKNDGFSTLRTSPLRF